MKQFEILEFPEGDCITINGCHTNELVKIKVSKKARKFANKSQEYCTRHKDAIVDLMYELKKDNPEVEFSGFDSDEFSFFTGENFQ